MVLEQIASEDHKYFDFNGNKLLDLIPLGSAIKVNCLSGVESSIENSKPTGATHYLITSADETHAYVKYFRREFIN